MVAAATRFSRNFVAQTTQFDGPEFHLKVAFYIILGAKIHLVSFKFNKANKNVKYDKFP